MDDEQSRRRARREYIRTHHPDRGGDPGAFTAGLAAYDRGIPRAPAAQIVVVPDPPVLMSLLSAVLRRMGWRRPPPRVK